MSANKLPSVSCTCSGDFYRHSKSSPLISFCHYCIFLTLHHLCGPWRGEWLKAMKGKSWYGSTSAENNIWRTLGMIHIDNHSYNLVLTGDSTVSVECLTRRTCEILKHASNGSVAPIYHSAHISRKKAFEFEQSPFARHCKISRA